MHTPSARYAVSRAARLRRLLLACTLTIPAVAAAQSDWTRSTGWPEDTGTKYIQVLALDPQNPSTIWAGGIGGTTGPALGRSDDGGLTWVAIEGPDAPNEVKSLVVHPLNTSTIYTGFNLVRRSDDGGAHWVGFAGPGGRDGWFAQGGVNTLAIDPHSPGRLWAATSEGPNGGLSRSDDGGQTWSAGGLTKEVYRILFDGRLPGTIYASSYDRLVLVDSPWYPEPYESQKGGPIYRSTDGGETWAWRATSASRSSASL